MFNEAFMFFYLISLVTSLSCVAVVVMVLCGIATVITTIVAGATAESEHEKQAHENAKSLLRKFFPTALLCLAVVVLTPPKEAFYAGAGQYVIEATEIDGTIMQLKEILDQKIAEELENGTSDE